MALLKLPYNGKVRLTSPYGNRMLNGVNVWHGGIDLVGETEKIIRAPCDATVGVSTIVYKENDQTSTWEWGNYIRLDCIDGRKIYLCHLAQRFVSAGVKVKTGDVLGIEGDTGYAFGSHCHFEIRVSNTQVDPTSYLGIQNVEGIYENKVPISVAPTNGTPGDGNTPHEWAEKAVRWAIAEKILRGDSSEKPDYRLNDPVTREEMLVFLHRTAEAIDEFLN